MFESRVIEVDGIFLGAAVSAWPGPGWRFVAADTRMAMFDGQTAPTLAEARRWARRAFLGARPPVQPAVPAES